MIRTPLSIFRKVLLVGLTLAAVGTATIWAVAPEPARGYTPFEGAPPSLDVSLLRGGRICVSCAACGLEDSNMGTETYGVEYLPMALAGRGFAICRFITAPGKLAFCEGWFVTFPYWFPCVAFLVYPTIAFIRYIPHPLRRYRRRKRGLCVRCGYNLTGNVSGVCPECGTAI